MTAACSTAPGVRVEAPIVASNASAALFPRGCVAADQPLASRAGARMLAMGGNAVDAAVAASFALSVVRPYSCGIGGGGFMVIHLGEGPGDTRSIALNYREVTPSGVDPLFYERAPDADASTRGGTAAAVPGTVAGLLHALERYGTLNRATVLAPAIEAARDGFVADEHFAAAARGAARKFQEHPEYRARFAFVWERFLRRGEIAAGDVIRNPEQARALGLIARDGAAAFYRGEIARAIVAAVRRDGGVMTMDDLGAYPVGESKPLSFRYGGRRFLVMPPPSSGGTAMAEALGVLERLPSTGDDEATRLHELAEAFRHAFADRAEWLADTAFEEVPVTRLMSEDYLLSLAARVRADRAGKPEEYGSRRAATMTAPVEDGGTSHLCAVDRWGNAVACTETINLEFGSMLAVSEFGFCLNNEMDDFLTRRGEANAFGLTQSDRNLPAPGKRPLSSMSPTIVLGEDGRVEAVAGASGGPRIITATTQALLNVLVRGMDAQESVGSPRLHHQWMPDRLELERAYRAIEGAEATAAALRARGHAVEFTGGEANVQLIRRVEKGWEAACDPRKGGRPAGE